MLSISSTHEYPDRALHEGLISGEGEAVSLQFRRVHSVVRQLMQQL